MTVADLAQAILAYRNGDVSLGRFEDWFRTASRGMFGESQDFLDACLAIEAAFSELHYGNLRRHDFGVRLECAIRPFAETVETQPTFRSVREVVVQFGGPFEERAAANPVQWMRIPPLSESSPLPAHQ